MKLSTNISDLVRQIAIELQKDRTAISGNTTGDLSELETTVKTSLLAAVNELNDVKITKSVARSEYLYRDQDPEADTIGDWRTWADDDGYYTEYCSVANATKGAGTWVLKHTIQP